MFEISTIAERFERPRSGTPRHRLPSRTRANYPDFRAAEIACAALSYQELFFRSAKRFSFLDLGLLAFEELTCFFVATLTLMRMGNLATKDL